MSLAAIGSLQLSLSCLTLSTCAGLRLLDESGGSGRLCDLVGGIPKRLSKFLRFDLHLTPLLKMDSGSETH